jgi:protein SCO1/2
MGLVAVGVLALTGAAVATLAPQSSDEKGPAADVSEVSRSGAVAPRAAFKGAVRPLAPPRDFSLRDQDGRLVRLADQRGKVVILAPMYTKCRDACPIVAQQIRAALDDLPKRERAQIVALALSVDPANDTPASARNFLFERRVHRHLDFLLGSGEELRPVWRAYGFSPQTEELEHNSYVVLIDRRGRQRVGFAIDYLTPEALMHDLHVLVRQPA